MTSPLVPSGILVAIVSAWLAHVTRQKLARIISDGRSKLLDLSEGEKLEVMELRYGFRFLLSRKTRYWYIATRMFDIVFFGIMLRLFYLIVTAVF